MSLKSKLSIITASLLTTLTTVVASPGHEEGTTTGMMMEGSWMHAGADIMGYNTWGMGWFGVLFGLALWILVILGIIYLYQQITQTGAEEVEKELEKVVDEVKE